jgi:TPR repeat protein
MSLARGFIVCVLLLTCHFRLAASPLAFTEDDFKEAQKGAESGDADAQLSLGIMYDLGQGVPQNFTEALKWYRLSAGQGNAAAQNNLGVMYLNGSGTAKNYFEGAKWIQMSANQGYAKGEMNLGLLFAKGTGVARNPASAVYWMRKGAEQGDPEAEERMGEIYAQGEIAAWDYIEAYKWLSLAAAQGDTDASKERDDLAEKMTAQGISEAQRRAAAFVAVKPPSAVNSATASGTGFFVTQDGYLVTAAHVVDGATKIVVKTKYLALGAAVVKMDKINDLAVLRITGAYPPGAMTNHYMLRNNYSKLAAVSPKFRPLTVANSSDAKLGDSVSTLGFPNLEFQGFTPKFTRGEINSLAGFQDDAHHFQISAQIQPGNSGGPLLDSSGAVIGVVQSTLAGTRQLLTTGTAPQNVNYALKSAYLLEFLKSVPGLKLPNSTVAAPAPNQPGEWVSDAQDSVAIVFVF